LLSNCRIDLNFKTAS